MFDFILTIVVVIGSGLVISIIVYDTIKIYDLQPVKRLRPILRSLRLKNLRWAYRKTKKQIKNKILQWRGKPIPMAKKIAIDLRLEKNGLEQVLKIKVAPEIEAFFKAAASKAGLSVEKSKKWLDAEGQGLKFYGKNEKMSGRVSGHAPVMDNFGNGLIDERGRINVALLRIVGASSEGGVTVKTDDLITSEEIRDYAEMLASWGKSFYEENLRDQDLTASITFEV